MKNKIILLLAVLCLGLPAFAQKSVSGNGGRVSFGRVTTTGQVGSYVSYANNGGSANNYTVDWSVAGTAPSVCTFQGEGSTDSVHWYALTTSTSCTTSSMFHIVYKPVVYFRINVLTYTAGDGTTAVYFNYTKGL